MSAINFANITEHGQFAPDLSALQIQNGQITIGIGPLVVISDDQMANNIESDISADFSLDGYIVTGAMISGSGHDNGNNVGEHASVVILSGAGGSCGAEFYEGNNFLPSCFLTPTQSGHFSISASVHSDISDVTGFAEANAQLTMLVKPTPEPSSMVMWGLIFICIMILLCRKSDR
jgi:hypothetical protein